MGLGSFRNFLTGLMPWVRFAIFSSGADRSLTVAARKRGKKGVLNLFLGGIRPIFRPEEERTGVAQSVCDGK
jgi:hypothetical protein